MGLPYPSDPALPSAPNPYFQDNGFVRGDQQRDNNAQLWANLAYLSKLGVVTNCKAVLSGTTLSLDALAGTISALNPIYVTVPLSSGLSQIVTISSALSMTLPSGTFTERILKLSNADGSATLPLSGDAAAVVLFWYVIYDTGTPYLAVSRSPFHTKTPANYYHTPSATGMTRVGAAEPGAWDAMIVSKTGALTDADSPAVCLGPLCYGTISGTNGRFSAMTLTAGEFPKWNNRQNPYKYDGTNVFRHIVRTDTPNGYGSTDTKIPKNTNISTSTGYAIGVLLNGGTVASGGIGGTEYVANEPGVYQFVTAFEFTGVSDLGASLNSNQRSTAVSSITLSTYRGRVGIGVAAFTDVIYLEAGDVWRPHTDGGTLTGRSVTTGVKLGWA